MKQNQKIKTEEQRIGEECHPPTCTITLIFAFTVCKKKKKNAFTSPLGIFCAECSTATATLCPHQVSKIQFYTQVVVSDSFPTHH